MPAAAELAGGVTDDGAAGETDAFGATDVAVETTRGEAAGTGVATAPHGSPAHESVEGVAAARLASGDGADVATTVTSPRAAAGVASTVGFAVGLASAVEASQGSVETDSEIVPWSCSWMGRKLELAAA